MSQSGHSAPVSISRSVLGMRVLAGALVGAVGGLIGSRVCTLLVGPWPQPLLDHVWLLKESFWQIAATAFCAGVCAYGAWFHARGGKSIGLMVRVVAAFVAFVVCAVALAIVVGGFEPIEFLTDLAHPL